MSREIPFFELFAQLQLSPELRLKLLGAVVVSACIQRQRSTAKWKAVAASPSRITAQPRKKLLDRVNSTAHTSMAMTRPSNRRRAAAPPARC